jgi:hypothetical protein
MERRSAVRHQVLKAGKIEFDGGAVICVAHNMSDNGAMLDVADPIGVPEHFILFLRADAVTATLTFAEIIRRNENALSCVMTRCANYPQSRGRPFSNSLKPEPKGPDLQYC